MKRLVFNKFYWGISNDPNIWGTGSLYNSEWVEIRENSKAVTLVRWNISTNQIWSASDIIMWYNVYDNSHFLRIHKNWYITNIFWSLIWDDKTYVINLWENLYNIWNLTTNSWNRWFIIWASNLYKWAYDWVNYFSLWIYNDNSSWLVTNWDFSSATWWTVWANWTITGWLATHTAWSTDVLSQTLSPTNWQAYRIEARTSWTITWSCVVKMWWATIWTITSTNKRVIWLRTAASTSELLEFVPSTDFVWSLENVEVLIYNLTSQAKTFNEKAPYIIIDNFIYIGNGNKITEVDTTTDSWVLTDVLTIDLDYTVKGITKVWDQVYIYASNWSSTKQYLWTQTDANLWPSITWVDKNCVNVANWANQDYIITKSNNSNKSWLWLVNWYQLQKIFENKIFDSAYLERIYFDASYTNAIETIWNKLMIPWVEWVYSYGQFTPWLPYWLSQDYKHYIWQNTALYYAETSSYQMRVGSIWTLNWTNWTYERLIQFNWYNNNPIFSWFIETSPISWDCVSNIKNLEKLTIGYKLETNTKLNVYSKNLDRTTQYANITYDYTTIPTIGAVYTSWGNTYTVYAVTSLSGYCILHCTYTWTATVLDWTFTKTSGTWDSTFYADKVKYWYKYESTITDTTKRRHTINTPEQFNEMSIRVELLTTNASYTPRLNDINVYYNETNDD